MEEGRLLPDLPPRPRTPLPGAVGGGEVELVSALSGTISPEAEVLDEETCDTPDSPTPTQDDPNDVGPAQTEGARSTPPIRFIGVKPNKRPMLYSENSYGLMARGRQTNHLTVECVVSVPARLFDFDDALSGFLPGSEGVMCTVNLLQQITCQQTLNPTLVEPMARNSWSADHSSHNTLTAPSVAKVTPIWEYSIQCQRISDSKTLIECNLAPHMTYSCGMPTFHYLRIGDRRFALGFWSTYFASKFHNRLTKALSHLCRQSKSTIAGSGESNLDATDDLDDDVFVTTDSTETPSMLVRAWPRNPLASRTLSSMICPSVSVTNYLNDSVQGVGDDNVFGSTPSEGEDRPPMDPECARPLGMLSLATVTPCASCHQCYSGSFKLSLSSDNEPSSAGSEPKKLSLSPKASETEHFKPRLVQSSSSGTEKTSRFGKMRSIRSSSNPGSIMFVQKLTAKTSREHDLTKSKLLSDSVHLRSGYGKEPTATYSLKNASFELIQRERCMYCGQWYNVKENGKGACPDAPDTVEKWIKRLTLYAWAQKFVNRRLRCRHGERISPPCECSCFHPEERQHLRRKAWFVALACLFPCLCCYVPLTSVYRSDAFYTLCTRCGAFLRCHRQQTVQTPPATARRHRRTLTSTSKHCPATPCPRKVPQASVKHVDGSRTSSSQQVLNDAYNPYRGYGALEGSTGPIGSEKTSGDGGVARKSSRNPIARLSF